MKLQLAGHARVALQSRGVELEGVELVLQLPLAQGRLDLQVQAPRLGLGGRGEAGGADESGMRSITAAAIVASAVLQWGRGRLRCGHGSRCRRSRPRRRASACPASQAS
ncbi:MAG: hypothetical protein IPG77_10980 [Betaproteobacteria bacterium]|nr:hypothetical protein [Betaproteobacteria bacterium]